MEACRKYEEASATLGGERVAAVRSELLTQLAAWCKLTMQAAHVAPKTSANIEQWLEDTVGKKKTSSHLFVSFFLEICSTLGEAGQGHSSEPQAQPEKDDEEAEQLQAVEDEKWTEASKEALDELLRKVKLSTARMSAALRVGAVAALNAFFVDLETKLNVVAAAIKAVLGACCTAASFREADIANAQSCRLV
jgi:hypothetical protein